MSGKVTINGTLCDVYTLYIPENGANNNYTYIVTENNNTPISYDYIGMTSSMAGYVNKKNNSKNYLLIEFFFF